MSINKRKGAQEEEKQNKEKQKRLKNMYLVNKLKYFSKASDAEILKQLDVNTMDQDTHRILQHRIRSDHCTSFLSSRLMNPNLYWSA